MNTFQKFCILGSFLAASICSVNAAVVEVNNVGIEDVTDLNSPEGFAGGVMNKFVNVYGVPVYGSISVRRRDFAYVASVVAEILDNNEDGILDSADSVTAFLTFSPLVVVFENQKDLDRAITNGLWPLPSIDGNLVITIFSDRSNPDRFEDGRVDDTLYHVLHSYVRNGLGEAIVPLSGQSGTVLNGWMNRASGGIFYNVPFRDPTIGLPTTNQYAFNMGNVSIPAKQWFHATAFGSATQDDLSREYLFWGILSTMGGLDKNGGFRQCSDFWELHTVDKMKGGDINLFIAINGVPGLELISPQPAFPFPRLEPNGFYNPGVNLRAEGVTDNGDGSVTLPGGEILRWVTPAGNPVTSPVDTGSGQNEFVFSEDSPGVLTLDIEMSVSNGTAAALTGFRFEVDSVGDSVFAWDGDSADGAPILAGTSVSASGTFTTLPTTNSGFGRKTIRLLNAENQLVTTASFEVFFPREALNNPSVTLPNWFYYWKDGNVGGLGADDVFHYSEDPDPDPDFIPAVFFAYTVDDDTLVTGAPIYLADLAPTSRVILTFDSEDPIYQTISVLGEGSGVYCAAMTVRLNRHRYELNERFLSQGDAVEDEDLDRVSSPDELNSLDDVLSNPIDADTYNFGDDASGDVEIRCRKVAGTPDFAINANSDWAKPGVNSIEAEGAGGIVLP